MLNGRIKDCFSGLKFEIEGDLTGVHFRNLLLSKFKKANQEIIDNNRIEMMI